MIKKHLFLFFVFITTLFVNYSASSQGFKVKSYSIGIRMFEITPVGNNPLTIGGLLKKPEPYFSYINTITYNSIFGNPEIRWRYTIYLNAEWTKKNNTGGFWKRNSISTGFNFTPKITLDAGAIADEQFIPPAYTKSIVLNMQPKNRNKKPD